MKKNLNIKIKGKVLVIAEAGINHNGQINKAKKLIDEAKIAGADVIKFQNFKTESLIQKDKVNKKLFKLLKKLELNFDDFKKLKKYSIRKGIIFAATPGDKKSVDELAELDVPFFKIASSDINNFHLLEHVVKKNKPIILSTGRSTFNEVKKTISFLKKRNCKRYNILHCVSTYPARFEDLNLNVIKLLKKKLKCEVGFSDHSANIEASIAAVALGATIIEKHLTLNKNDVGPDHKASLEPMEFKRMVQGIRNLELALGSEQKKPMKSELIGRLKSRKSIFANRNIFKNSIIKESDIICKRPVIGITPENFEKVIGCRAKKTIKENEPITWGKITKSI